MRALILLGGIVLLAACSNNDQQHNVVNVDDNLRPENIVSNDVTAIDAVTGDAANMAAEADFTMLDEEISRAFDYESGHHRFKGTMQEVIAQYNKDALEAKKWFDKLQHIIDAYVSPEWTTASIARQGSLRSTCIAWPNRSKRAAFERRSWCASPR